ncbi:histidine phosphotransferase [Pseudorhodobacter sp. E13]|uniref:histidine phosphotransferase family protein n=1 Tax=Pseudorhodobacter sp. E13 TaxID=2487931 RepID=UPI000F8F3A50|nr:histidine phosphotransferase family protein [Pseudorhodobacter sp. E13]RUS63122.1 histidine phosphotransferase [Pseudorhodobacter sp. E13]
MTDHADLAALLGSRICHDLISPIGAIGNGVELLMMENNTPSPELALIAESVAAANARIRFFRVAFGLSGGDQRIGRPELTKTLADTTQGGRISIDWQRPGDALRREAKLAFLAILCCESALAFGGRITITQEEAKWHIVAQAERLRIDADLWDSLSKPGPELSPAQVHFALLPAELSVQDQRLRVQISDTEIKLSF